MSGVHFTDKTLLQVVVKYTALVVCAFSLISYRPSIAQSIPDIGRMGQASSAPPALYKYSEPGDVIVFVKVWGAVRNPGLYEVKEGTRLSTVYTLAGGPATGDHDQRTRRTTSIDLLRPEGAEMDTIFSASMRDRISFFRQDPVLVDGDVLTVQTHTHARFSWRDLIPFVSAAATLTLVIERLIRN